MLLYPYEMDELSTRYITLARGFLYNPIKDFLNVVLYVEMGVGMIRKGRRIKAEG
jgi:hypothetical protein